MKPMGFSASPQQGNSLSPPVLSGRPLSPTEQKTDDQHKGSTINIGMLKLLFVNAFLDAIDLRAPIRS